MRALEGQRVEDVAKMVHERIDRVLRSRDYFVGKAVTLEVNRDYPEPCISEGGHGEAIGINRTAPPWYQQDGGTAWLSALDGANGQPGGELEKTRFVLQKPGGKDLAGADSARFSEQHYLRCALSVQPLCVIVLTQKRRTQQWKTHNAKALSDSD